MQVKSFKSFWISFYSSKKCLVYPLDWIWGSHQSILVSILACLADDFCSRGRNLHCWQSHTLERLMSRCQLSNRIVDRWQPLGPSMLLYQRKCSLGNFDFLQFRNLQFLCWALLRLDLPRHSGIWGRDAHNLWSVSTWLPPLSGRLLRVLWPQIVGVDYFTIFHE